LHGAILKLIQIRLQGTNPQSICLIKQIAILWIISISRRILEIFTAWRTSRKT